MSGFAATAQAFGPDLLVAALAAPFVVLAASLSIRLRAFAWAITPLAAAPALAAAILAIGGAPFGAELPALRTSLWLDRPGAMLLLAAALVWLIRSIFALTDGAGRPNGDRFAVAWLLTMAGSFGVFIAADLLTFYLVYALVSVPAYYLVAHDEDGASRRAGGVYMAFARIGEAVLLLAFVMLAAGEPGGSVQIRDVVAALPASPWRDAALALIIVGFGMKIALVPLHGWMPLAYTAAPIPAAAVLSGAAVKAEVIGLIRFLPFGAALPYWGEALAWLGFVSAFFGVAIGVTQRNPKTTLAYSSVSQMGVIAAALGMGLAGADKDALADAAFYAANHVLVKAALFLTIGVVGRPRRTRAVGGPDRGRGAGLEPRRPTADRRRARQARGQGGVRRRRRRRRGGAVRGWQRGAHALLRDAARRLARRRGQGLPWAHGSRSPSRRWSSPGSCSRSSPVRRKRSNPPSLCPPSGRSSSAPRSPRACGRRGIGFPAFRRANLLSQKRARSGPRCGSAARSSGPTGACASGRRQASRCSPSRSPWQPRDTRAGEVRRGDCVLGSAIGSF